MNAQYRLIAEAVRAYGSPAGLKQVPADLCCPQGYIVPMKYPGNSGRSQFSVGAGLESGIAPCHYNPPSFPLLIGGNLENWPRYVQQLPYYTVSTPQEAAARWKADGMR
jgi:hypothetical protein